MFKLIVVLISLFVIGFLMVHDTWMVTITAFDFEITTSVVTIVVAFILLLYIFHLLKKPFVWISGYQAWYQNRRQSQKEAYLLLALKTVLDHDSAAEKKLMKQKNTFFDKKSDENYLIDALFAPSPHTFEQLLHRPETELAGIRGLLTYAQKEGDLQEVSRLLKKAAQTRPGEPWIYDALWTVQTLQSDWSEALTTLETLKKQEQISRDEYTVRRAAILLKLGQVKEAYRLIPDHPEAALAYAQSEPKKAVEIIMKLWQTTPCWDAFVLFQKAIADDKPTKQVKLVEKLVHHNPDHRLSLLAQAQVAMDNGLWGAAKEHLTTYLSLYPVTAMAARMMAETERQGWHHTEAAQEWDEKAGTAPTDFGWGCADCGHMTTEWDALCPNCNAFGRIRYK